MKKILLTLAAVVLSAGMLSAQDLSQATETAKMANESLVAGNKALALTGFQEALAQAAACGEEGEELVATCKGVIPNIMLSIAKDLIKESNFDDAVTKLNEVVAKAKEYAADEIADEAATLIPQALMAKGGDLLKDKNFTAAAEAYKSALALDPENGNLALRLGQALAGAGQVEEAVAAFETAAKNGQEELAGKQISNIYLKKAAAALKAGKFADAVAAAEKCNEYGDNAQAYLVAGQASQKLNKNADAIKNFEKYLAAAPTAKNANAIAFTVAALYQKAGNKAKAKEFYQKVVSDPQLGAQAKQQLDALK
ncbi:MAG: tetratricopeptide repeat protein [Bacteroidales bacterium]|nr:tetratricopeptide repeat protein [Bacteroidales bacterium]